jgi:hypothetical protein
MASAEVKPTYLFPAKGFKEIRGAGDADLIALLLLGPPAAPCLPCIAVSPYCYNSRYATIDNNVSKLAYFYNLNSL